VVGPREMCSWRDLQLDRVNLLCDDDELPERVMAQVRYRQSPQAASLERLDATRLRLRFDEPQFAVTVGQSAVVYDGTRLLGGGVIRQRGEGGAPVAGALHAQ
jgi:tRNA-uridine 2-sulfurtransferase